jgi:hypothetical protein
MVTRSTTKQGRRAGKSAAGVGGRRAKPKTTATQAAGTRRRPVKTARSMSRVGSTGKPAARATGTVKLLAGGNPQIAKGSGDAPVQAYIAAMPGWKRAVGKRLDTLITDTVPGVRKAVKWNSPFYGAPDQEGWFLSLHCYAHYIKVAFFAGASLKPVPPEASKIKAVRYLHIHDGEFDETQLVKWIKQAVRLPGEKM